jgi:K+/H+ antiporter YhaU regulatory subunit KhtT
VLDGRTVADAGGAVLAVRRADGAVLTNPPPDLLLREGDTVLVLEAPALGDASTGR